MAAAEIARGEGAGLRGQLARNLGAVALVFALLEVWRPCYFLTDDNLDLVFPLMAGRGYRMVHGQSPFVSDYLFGGNYNMLRDSTDFFWHPIYFVASLVANSPVWYATIDVIAFFFIMTAAAGFVCLAHFLRTELRLELSDGRLMLLLLSYSFSMILLCIGSSWVFFLGNNSAMPWLALGILQTSWRRGLGLVGLFSVHHLLGGHLEAAISTTLFLTLFAMGVAFWRRSFWPLVWWFGGYAIALVVISPLLVPVVNGFLATNRAQGGTIAWMNFFAVPATLFPFSYFLSTFSTRLQIPYEFGECQVYYSAAFVSCAAAWALIPALMSRAAWTRLQASCLVLVGLGVLLAIRPAAVSFAMMHLPLLKSTRWPFREIVQMQFFLHLFFVLRPWGGSPSFRRGIVGFGVLMYVLPLPFLPAPSFNTMTMDRELLFSGRAEKYWGSVKTLIGPDTVLVPVAFPQTLKETNVCRFPFTLSGACNYPNLFHVRSAGGYSGTVPMDKLYLRTPPITIWGIYGTQEERRVLAERTNVRFITVVSVDPLKIVLTSKSGPPLDLTPLIPPP